jgi:murein DD-endopeptidase MepM/ murein hydrolase activator NlpD
MIASGVFADEPVDVDNSRIQQYRGHQGIWTRFESTSRFNSLIHEFGVTEKAVAEINDADYSKREYVFIPYSEEYLSALDKNGIRRKTVVSGENEFIWPIEQFDKISSPFGYRYGQLHTGADMPSPRGYPIVASMDGKVISSGYAEGHGITLLVEHRNGFYTRYSHNSFNLVKKGDYVKKGQIIALVGSTGKSTGNHLHFEVRYNDVPLNPLDFLPPREELKEPHMMKRLK